VFEKPSKARFLFEGTMGERVKANLENWLLRAPVANPGMIEMFRLRDRSLSQTWFHGRVSSSASTSSQRFRRFV